MPKLKGSLPAVVPVVLLALLPGSLGAAEPQGRPPNIIVLLNDDQGSGDLGVAGHPFIKTPHLDRLAQQGCRFTDFYATAPVCSPSRAGFITGRIQNRFGLHQLINGGEKANLPLFQYIPPTEPMLPRLLRQAGYATAHFGKWHCSFSERPGSPSMR
ncbi:MAG: sulfatase-like hydrolase/transferase, partial [Pirellulales bacterium]